MAVITATKPTLGVPQRPLRRSNSDFVLGGVCAGLAIRLGVKERNFRLLFTLGSFVFGLGPLLYVALWLFLARSGEEKSIAQRLGTRRRASNSVLLSFIVVIAILLILPSFSIRNSVVFAGSFLLSAVGIVAVWLGSSSDERSQLEALVSAAPLLGTVTARGWKAVLIRIVPGLILVVIGLKFLNRIGGVWGAAVPALLGTMVLLVGVLVLFAPWWLRTVRELSSERRERVRIEERSAMITHIHDSVLQTLTLIERAAANEADVIRLARSQERELRQWLFNPTDVGANDPQDRSFAALVGTIERDIENDYGVKVELVVVGDCAPDENVVALVAAGREAAINAAKWSGATSISLFAEVEPAAISLFVRDTGQGFAIDQVANDRQGITRSIKLRMIQHGGTATIRSTPGSGTEVELVLARSAK